MSGIKPFYSADEKREMYEASLFQLREIFKALEPNKFAIMQNLIDSVAFMNAELKELEQVIRRDGTVEEYRNGACQRGYKKSSSVEVYNTMLKNYTTCVKQLIDVMKSDNKEVNEDAFEDFCAIRTH